MKPRRTLVCALTLVTAFPATAATIIENWQFNEVVGTQFTGLVNTAGSASWSGNAANVKTDGAGNLVFTVGDSTTANVFRNSSLTVPDITTGTYQMEWLYSSA